MRKPSPAMIVALLGLFVGLGGVGIAANGQSLILGKPDNAATAKTGLSASINDRTFALTNNSTGSSATALGLNVASGRPPLIVNSGAGKATNLDADKLDGLDSSGFWKLGGNALASTGTLGTTTNQALDLRVNGQRALRLEPKSNGPNVIGGYSANAVQAGAYGATIAGGGKGLVVSRPGNVVSDNFGTVGGGEGNVAGDQDSNHDPTTATLATVGGGDRNSAVGFLSTVGGGATNFASGGFSTVGGGTGNSAGGDSSTIAGGLSNEAGSNFSTVAGGFGNAALANYSVVGGGESNAAFGSRATIPGGERNEATGTLSFAAGFRARATDFGSFVWGDSKDFVISSYGTDTFTVRATGGARFVSGINAFTGAPTNGVMLAPFGGSWASLSDRNAKERFARVDRKTLLRRLDRIPIERWSYKGQKPGIRHLGPTAQDFYAAFGLGEDDRHITTVDADGVALAAVQGLYRQNHVLKEQNRGLRAQLQAQNARLTRLERQVAKLSR